MAVLTDEGLVRLRTASNAVALLALAGVAASIAGVIVSPRLLLSPTAVAARISAAAAASNGGASAALRVAPADARILAWQRARVLFQFVALGAFVAPLPLSLLGDAGTLIMRSTRHCKPAA